MRVRALAFRIINQLRHDRRTLALMLVAPLFLLTLVYFILAETVPIVNVAVINAPAGFEDQLEEQNIRGIRYDEPGARLALEKGDVIASISIIGGKSYIEIDGSNPTKAKVALAAMEQAKNSMLRGGGNASLVPT
jgi:ABC-2 type transport system permease protein